MDRWDNFLRVCKALSWKYFLACRLSAADACAMRKGVIPVMMRLMRGAADSMPSGSFKEGKILSTCCWYISHMLEVQRGV